MGEIKRLQFTPFAEHYVQSEEPISHEKLLEFADHLVKQLKETLRGSRRHESGWHIIIDGLSDKAIFLASFYQTKEELTPSEIENVKASLVKLRRALFDLVLEKIQRDPDLQTLVHPEDINIIERYINPGGTIYELQTINPSTKILKEPHASSLASVNAAAMEKLLQLPSHPNIFLPTAFDPGTRTTVSPHKDIITLEDITFESTTELENIPSFLLTDLLKAIRDAMQGSQFLLKHGLVIEDIIYGNIGIERDKSKGYLFDFDQMIPVSETLEELYRPAGYKDPPGHIPSYECDMVQSFATVLQNVVEKYSKKQTVNPEVLHTLKKVITRLKTTHRIGLTQAIAELDAFLEK